MWKVRFGKGTVNQINYSPDGTKLAVASSIGIWIYDAQTGKQLHLYTGHKGEVYSVVFSPDGKTLASGSRDRTVRLWDANTGALIKILAGQSGPVFRVAFSPDGQTIACGCGSRTFRLWYPNTDEDTQWLSGGRTELILSVEFSPDGKMLAIVFEDGTIQLLANTGEHIKTITGHTNSVNCVAFSQIARNSQL